MRKKRGREEGRGRGEGGRKMGGKEVGVGGTPQQGTYSVYAGTCMFRGRLFSLDLAFFYVLLTLC